MSSCSTPAVSPCLARSALRFGSAGSDNGHLSGPLGVAAIRPRRAARRVVADTGNSLRVQMLRRTDQYLPMSPQSRQSAAQPASAWTRPAMPHLRVGAFLQHRLSDRRRCPGAGFRPRPCPAASGRTMPGSSGPTPALPSTRPAERIFVGDDFLAAGGPRAAKPCPDLSGQPSLRCSPPSHPPDGRWRSAMWRFDLRHHSQEYSAHDRSRQLRRRLAERCAAGRS